MNLYLHSTDKYIQYLIINMVKRNMKKDIYVIYTCVCVCVCV